MRFKKYVKKSLNVIFWWMDKFSRRSYIKLYPRYLKWLGVNIDTENYKNTWISPTVFLDSTQYDLITIGGDVGISFDVAILVHDYSVKFVGRAVGDETHFDEFLTRPVVIGNNVFIGARTMILPGATIGDNCIIGAGSVVKGVLKANTVYAGNPAREIRSLENYQEMYRQPGYR